MAQVCLRAPHPHRTTPNGSATLVCQLGSAPQLVGPQTGPTEEHLRPGSVVVGIRLRPGAASALFRVSALNLVDRTVRLDGAMHDPVATQAVHRLTWTPRRM
jgi:hypothetical protein